MNDMLVSPNIINDIWYADPQFPPPSCHLTKTCLTTQSARRKVILQREYFCYQKWSVLMRKYASIRRCQFWTKRIYYILLTWSSGNQCSWTGRLPAATFRSAFFLDHSHFYACWSQSILHSAVHKAEVKGLKAYYSHSSIWQIKYFHSSARIRHPSQKILMSHLTRGPETYALSE